MSLGNLRSLLVLCALLVALLACSSADAQLRVVTYNTATAQSGSGTQLARLPYSSTILEAIGLESYGPVEANKIARPIDVLLLQEQFEMETTTQSFVDILNDLYDPINRTMYARGDARGTASSDFGPFPGAGGRPGMVYNTTTVELIDEAPFGSVGSGEIPARQFLRYQFRPMGYDSNSDFYAYSSHYRAGDSAENATSRLNEAIALRNNSDALGEGTHAIYAGDYNITSSNASMYQELISAGNGQAFDPVATPGTWLDNGSVKHVHTQSPAATGENIPGYAGGGMDDRYDFQLITGEVQDGDGFDYIPGSYHAFGNNGTHAINGSITTGTGASVDVLNALKANSDHIPVVADYQLPAKMFASLGTVPMNVAQGATVGIDVFVQNVASVLNATWADELDYTINVSGALLGSASDTTLPLASGNSHQIFLNTGTEGFRAGVVTVSATSQGAANALYQFPINFIVGEGNGGPVFGVIAKDTFDEDESLLTFAQSPAPGAFGDAGDGFEEYKIGVSPTFPFQLVDESTTVNPSDTRGIVDRATKTDAWFGVTDTVNSAGQPVSAPGTGTATWTFDISGAIDMQVSIDMGAMGDFEATGTNGDRFDWTYQIDNGPILSLFDSIINESINGVPYTMADGDVISLDDPVQMVTTDNQTFTLSNIFQTLTSPISGLGDTLIIQLTARTDGGDEGYAFDNIIIEGTTFVSFLEADFNQDGSVDALDLAEWQADFGLNANSDADFDGDTDGRDFLIWQRQYGQSSLPLVAGSTAAVPEPNSLLLIGTFACLWVVSQRPKELY